MGKIDTARSLPIEIVEEYWRDTKGGYWEPAPRFEAAQYFHPVVLALISEGWVRRCSLSGARDFLDKGCCWTGVARAYFSRFGGEDD
jgi:hypothetical protein